MGEPEIQVVIDDEPGAVEHDPITDTITTAIPDGGVVIQLNAGLGAATPEKADFYENLALRIDPLQLNVIANDLLEAIQTDDQSRQEWLNNTTMGMRLLGLEVEQSTGSDVGASSAPVEGMSTVKSPLLLEACLRGWANSVGELLPAAGPVKIEDEKPVSAVPAGMVGHNGGPSLDHAEAAKRSEERDALADALKSDMNRYLTTIATEYYPDTSSMLLWGVHFSGSGIKKLYRCPMRRRPVSESVPLQDFIVSNATKDLRSCGRITHAIKMRPSVMKRMMHLGAYRDVPLTQPAHDNNVVDQQIAEIQGILPANTRPEDQPYNLYETQCELDLDEYAPADFRGSGIPLPYLVTIDKDSRQILSLRRDWYEDDPQAERKRMYVKYTYVPGPGFYGTGLLGILGNSSAAMTAAWREALDAGAFASFPGFMYAKMAGRQLTNEFRVGPGQGIGVELPANVKISDAIMALPYKDATPGLMKMIETITAAAQRLGSTAELPTGEGRADIPVGTMIAMIEQATKVMAATHKGLHTSQSEEFQVLLQLFRENPEDFWRFNRKCATQWDEQKFLKALEDCYLVPVSDPNIPSHMHRVAKNVALGQLADSPSFGPMLDKREILERMLRDGLQLNPEGLMLPPQPAQPSPEATAKLAETQAKVKKADADMIKAVTTAQNAEADRVVKEKEIMGRVAVSQNQEDRAAIIHADDNRRQNVQAQADIIDKRGKLGLGLARVDLEQRKLVSQERQAGQKAQIELHKATMPKTPKGS